MFLMKGHGVTAVSGKDYSSYRKGSVMGAEAACGFLPGEYPQSPKSGDFGYLFENAASLPENADAMTAALDNLAVQTVEHEPSTNQNSNIPPVFTYMGQFIDHDVTANTDRESGVSVIDVETVVQLPRGEVTAILGNLRLGSLNLDSLYGGQSENGPVSKMLTEAMRWDQDRAKMQAGVDEDVDSNGDGTADIVRPPNDPARDLPRAGSIPDRLDLGLLNQASEEVRSLFIDDNGELIKRRAVIGDKRNDENLAVGQFHLSMIRLHNKIVDEAPGPVSAQGREKVFEWAQARTRWIYQWLVSNAYLPAVCDPDVLAQVRKNGPVLYLELFDRMLPENPDFLPLPLEFSVAAFRFGHSMARESYDWNPFFGRSDGSVDPVLDRASLDLLFLFTSDSMPSQSGRLPSNWPIGWDRFVHPPSAAMPDRAARLIDTKLARVLGTLPNDPPGDTGVLKHLARRNLRRGYRLNVPTAQGCISEFKRLHGIDLPVLDNNDLLSGHTGPAVAHGGFGEATPLWFYILKEAEVMAGGNHLGPLGSMIVADTLLGLIEKTPGNYVDANVEAEAWKPADAVSPNGVEITDMPSMMAAAGVL